MGLIPDEATLPLLLIGGCAFVMLAACFDKELERGDYD